MNTKKTSHAQQQQEEMWHLQRVVCVVLQISSEDQSRLMYDSGLEYLCHYVPDAGFRATISQCSIYWAWWRNHWATRDRLFLNSREKGDTLSQHWDDYLWLHNPRVLCGQIHPNAVVLHRSYATMIGAVIKKEVCA